MAVVCTLKPASPDGRVPAPRLRILLHLRVDARVAGDRPMSVESLWSEAGLLIVAMAGGGLALGLFLWWEGS